MRVIRALASDEHRHSGCGRGCIIPVESSTHHSAAFRNAGWIVLKWLPWPEVILTNMQCSYGFIQLTDYERYYLVSSLDAVFSPNEKIFFLVKCYEYKEHMAKTDDRPFTSKRLRATDISMM